MNQRQRRAHRNAARAISELAQLTFDDQSAFNQTLALLTRSLGALIGTSTAAFGQSVDVLNTATVRCASYAQEQAAKAYGEYLAHEKTAKRRDDA